MLRGHSRHGVNLPVKVLVLELTVLLDADVVSEAVEDRMDDGTAARGTACARIIVPGRIVGSPARTPTQTFLCRPSGLLQLPSLHPTSSRTVSSSTSTLTGKLYAMARVTAGNMFPLAISVGI